MSSSPRRILFVCLGNICRSPAAEGVFRKLAGVAGLAEAAACDSCGTAGWHTGKLADSRMREAAAQRGVVLEHRARTFHPDDFQKFDLILTMDDDNLETVSLLARNDPAALARVKPFAAYCRKTAPAHIPDPYYGGPEGFEHVLDLLEEGCAALVDEIKNENSEKRGCLG